MNADMYAGAPQGHPDDNDDDAAAMIAMMMMMMMIYCNAGVPQPVHRRYRPYHHHSYNI